MDNPNRQRAFASKRHSPTLAHSASLSAPEVLETSRYTAQTGHTQSLDAENTAARDEDDRMSSLSSDLEMEDLDERQTPYSNEETRGRTGHYMEGDRDGAMDAAASARAGERIGYQNFIQKSIANGILIALWYVFSITISVYNKWMFSKGNLDFPYPLFTTAGHMLMQFTLASLVLLCIPKLRPSRGSVHVHHLESMSPEREAGEHSDKPVMTPWFYLASIVPCGTATSLDIGLGNMSLKYITLTFFTMCKSSVLGFVLLFALFFKLEKPSWKLFAIIAVMTVGVVMMVAGETSFNLFGFLLLMTASFSSGLRWSLTQILLRRNPATSNPFASLFFLTPVMFLVLLIIAIPVEGFAGLKDGLTDLSKARGPVMGVMILLFPGFLAFLMTASEFALLKRTSVVTLSVCGIFKEVITIATAGMVYHDPLTALNISGLLVTIVAIVAYNTIRIKKMKKKEIKDAQAGVEEHAPMLSAEHGTDSSTRRESGVRTSTNDMIPNSLSNSRNRAMSVGTDEATRGLLAKLPEDSRHD